ncbi:MAG: usg protein [Rhodospirillaceae bacterium]|nr:usg protein [Rhodospirillaceae bacterium]
MSSLTKQLKNYRLTTAHIFYHMPDHPKFLQEYVWQDLDLAPKFPVLKNFLDFWQSHLDGKLHSVTVGHCRLITPAEFRAVQHQLVLH